MKVSDTNSPPGSRMGSVAEQKFVQYLVSSFGLYILKSIYRYSQVNALVFCSVNRRYYADFILPAIL